MRSFTKIFFSIFIFSILIPQTSFADVTLPQIIGSNMVVQRNQEIKVWGWADKNEKVTVHFNDAVNSIRADKNGKWMIQFQAMKAGGPYTMKIRGKNIIDLENILIGDVWICSGQSNMEYSFESFPWAEEEAGTANFQGIRLFTVAHNVQFVPVEDIPEGDWQECNSETVLPFSAVAYFFGREVHKDQKIPIGLISTNWGGTDIETWISGEAISEIPEFSEKVEILNNIDPEEKRIEMEAEIREILDKYAADKPGIQDGEAVWASPDLDVKEWGEMELPGNWENKGLGGLDGIVWFRYEFYLEEGIEAGNEAILELGSIDDSDITWVNGRKVGGLEMAWDQDRIYQVNSEYLKKGKNIIAIRVEDTGGGGGFNGTPEQMRLLAGENIISLAGPWRFRISPVNLDLMVNNSVSPNSDPTLLYNGMIHPLLNYPVKGVTWYQGENNTGRAYQYRSLFPMMIEDWRAHWNQPDMTFLFVQLANYKDPPMEPRESDWAELREAQAMTLSLPNTGMAVAIDIGEADDIHPINKKDVGKRLALSALKLAYAKDIVYSGPMFREMSIDGQQAVLSFDHIGSGLLAKGRYGYLKGFAIAGEDKVFHWAKANIHEDQVLVYSDHVKHPVSVRYGWADNPDDVNLFNKEGLPASPFRTDDWQGITFQK